MTMLVELGFHPTTVLALRHCTIHACAYTMLILECLYKCPSINTCPSEAREGDTSSVNFSLISCSPNPRGYNLSYGYKEWGNDAGD